MQVERRQALGLRVEVTVFVCGAFEEMSECDQTIVLSHKNFSVEIHKYKFVWC